MILCCSPVVPNNSTTLTAISSNTAINPASGPKSPLATSACEVRFQPFATSGSMLEVMLFQRREIGVPGGFAMPGVVCLRWLNANDTGECKPGKERVSALYVRVN